MGSTYTNLLIHIVFSTKRRIPYITGPRCAEVFAYLGGLVRESGGIPLSINGVQDHVHLLIRLPAKLCVADAVRFLKSNSALWIRRDAVLHPGFAWQEGYAAFSVSESAVSDVSRYILNQPAHHAKRSFQEELVQLLKRNRIEYDERYIWS